MTLKTWCEIYGLKFWNLSTNRAQLTCKVDDREQCDYFFSNCSQNNEVMYRGKLKQNVCNKLKYFCLVLFLLNQIWCIHVCPETSTKIFKKTLSIPFPVEKSFLPWIFYFYQLNKNWKQISCNTLSLPAKSHLSLFQSMVGGLLLGVRGVERLFNILLFASCFFFCCF